MKFQEITAMITQEFEPKPSTFVHFALTLGEMCTIHVKQWKGCFLFKKKIRFLYPINASSHTLLLQQNLAIIQDPVCSTRWLSNRTSGRWFSRVPLEGLFQILGLELTASLKRAETPWLELKRCSLCRVPGLQHPRLISRKDQSLTHREPSPSSLAVSPLQEHVQPP